MSTLSRQAGAYKRTVSRRGTISPNVDGDGSDSSPETVEKRSAEERANDMPRVDSASEVEDSVDKRTEGVDTDDWTFVHATESQR
ncbi:hypothetical protein GRX03_10570 [Halovenus sp. WSH3]|uniref:Uncharacterized protein n=1 Tax=Halovenus carboxidivorans TaxID=2692199 RepID=A0A6B0TAW5_9EURY|nr:hypothetical protein [Halovenus carboxidivorans]MXR52040.1 hypothetical protein [Halovenus carboxidivorans]